MASTGIWTLFPGSVSISWNDFRIKLYRNKNTVRKGNSNEKIPFVLYLSFWGLMKPTIRRFICQYRYVLWLVIPILIYFKCEIYIPTRTCCKLLMHKKRTREKFYSCSLSCFDIMRAVYELYITHCIYMYIKRFQKFVEIWFGHEISSEFSMVRPCLMISNLLISSEERFKKNWDSTING